MKQVKYVCPFFLLCLLWGCGTNESLSTNEQSVHHEIGESVHEQQYDDTSVINIVYPKLRIEVLDQAIATTIQQEQTRYEQDRSDVKQDQRTELNIDYQSYVKDDRYISIKLDVFTSIHENKETIHTMVYDKENEEFITLSDLLNQEALATLSESTKQHFETETPEECGSQNFAIFSAPSASNFEKFVMRKDGFVFYFEQGTLFDHSAYMEVPYEELADTIDLESEELTAFVPYEDILNEPVKHIDPNKPMIALTFDDGPTKKYTTAILDALKEYQASATFFVLGSRANDFPDILQRMVLEGNEIGNHTFSHKQLTTLSKENVEEEISATQESIHGVTNKYPSLIRPPYGSKNDTVMQCANGKKIVTWSLDTEDWKSRNTETIVNKVLKEVQDGDIILMHDLYASTAEAAIILIPKLQDMGYQLVTVSELYEYGKNDAGKIM